MCRYIMCANIGQLCMYACILKCMHACTKIIRTCICIHACNALIFYAATYTYVAQAIKL